MDRRQHVVLGKRGRRPAASDPVDAEADEMTPRATAKRSRARRFQRTTDKAVDAASLEQSTDKARSGLLTPEASTLTESQIATQHDDAQPPQSTDDAQPSHSMFPFMKLPAELRLHIYFFALVRLEPGYLHAERSPEMNDEGHSSVATHMSTHPFYPDTPDMLPNLRIAPRAISPCADLGQSKDPLVPALLQLNKQVYREARQVLYSENIFILSLESGNFTLSSLHQRSRSLIKHVVLTIPSHHDILDGFADLVRLGLRYCWGLKTFKIILHAALPDDGRMGSTSVYANAFHILRWLPRGCSVVLEGHVSDNVRRVVVEEGRLMSVLDEVSLRTWNPGCAIYEHMLTITAELFEAPAPDA
jgi:epsin